MIHNNNNNKHDLFYYNILKYKIKFAKQYQSFHNNTYFEMLQTHITQVQF